MGQAAQVNSQRVHISPLYLLRLNVERARLKRGVLHPLAAATRYNKEVEVRAVASRKLQLLQGRFAGVRDSVLCC